MSLKDKVKKILPYAAVGVVGVALIVVIVVAMKKRSKTAGSVLAPLADPAYGTATASDIPLYDQYQDGRSPTSDVKSLQANPTSLNLTYTGAIPPAPVNIVANVRCFATYNWKRANAFQGTERNGTCLCKPRMYGSIRRQL